MSGGGARMTCTTFIYCAGAIVSCACARASNRAAIVDRVARMRERCAMLQWNCASRKGIPVAVASRCQCERGIIPGVGA